MQDSAFPFVELTFRLCLAHFSSCWGLSEWQQPFGVSIAPPGLVSLQTFWGCLLSHHPDHHWWLGSRCTSCCSSQQFELGNISHFSVCHTVRLGSLYLTSLSMKMLGKPVGESYWSQGKILPLYSSCLWSQLFHCESPSAWSGMVL